MAITVSQAYIDTFEANVRHLAQQKTARLRMCCTEVNKQSEAHNWERLAASTARNKTSARAESPAGGNGSGAVGATDGLTWSRRKSLIGTYDIGEVVEPEDIVQTLVDPKSAVSENLVMGMNRKMDDVIIEAATGPATDGDGSSVTFPVGQTVGDGTTEISLDTVLEIDELFYTNDVDPDEEKYFIIGPKQRRKLLQLIEVTSSDFQSDRQALATGYLPSFLGYNWIVSNRLNVPTADDLDCLIMTKKAIGLHIAGDIESRVAERSDMSFAWQLYMKMHIGAVRVEDEHIVKFVAADTVT